MAQCVNYNDPEEMKKAVDEALDKGYNKKKYFGFIYVNYLKTLDEKEEMSERLRKNDTFSRLQIVLSVVLAVFSAFVGLLLKDVPQLVLIFGLVVIICATIVIVTAYMSIGRN